MRKNCSCGSFNPCFNGSDSKRINRGPFHFGFHVSILVLMEVTLKGPVLPC